jgi:hypothetical protein
VSNPRRKGTELIGKEKIKGQSKRKKGGCNTVSPQANVEAARSKQKKNVKIQEDGEAGKRMEQQLAGCRSPRGLRKKERLNG